jgi:Na+-driven multidrug efflux pump
MSRCLSAAVAHYTPQSKNPVRRALQQVGFQRTSFDAEILSLGLPTLGAVLIDPCLSLVDTMFVGRLGAVALGAMGPCTALFNFVFATAR